MTGTECPYLRLTERDLEGTSLSDEEERGLCEHLAGGCPACEERIQDHLEGSGEGEPAAEIRALNVQVDRAVGYAERTMEPGKVAVLEKLQRTIADEDRSQRRRARRRLQRIVFYIVNLAAVISLAMIYALFWTNYRVKTQKAKLLATRTELGALASALARYEHDHRTLPNSEAGLIEALQRTRTDLAAPYYPFAKKRLKAEGYVDDFDRPYRLLVRRNRVLIYSVGPDGVDQGGEGDDVKPRGGWITFPLR